MTGVAAGSRPARSAATAHRNQAHMATVPATASPELQKSIAGAYRVPNWNANPKDAAGWNELINRLAAAGAAAQPALREKLGVTMQKANWGGVPVFILTHHPRESIVMPAGFCIASC